MCHHGNFLTDQALEHDRGVADRVFRFKTLGSMTCFRLNIRSCLVRLADRSPAFLISLSVGPQRITGFQLREEKVAVAVDGRKEIIKVMRNAGRKSSDTLQLLSLEELALQLQPLGYVTLYRNEAG